MSSASPELTDEALAQLLKESQSRNKAKNLTGLLLHADGSIIQIIEGNKEDVEQLFNKIIIDHRHYGVTVLSRKPVEQRDFPQYSMGYRRANRKRLQDNISGFSDIVERGAIPADKLENVSTLVATFLRTFARSTRLKT